MAINIPNIATKAVNEAKEFTKPFFMMLSFIVDYINNNPKILEYNGSPEGNLVGRYKDQCWDTVNNKMYFKTTAVSNTGWVQI